MKLAIFLTIISSLHVSARGYGQTLTLSMKNVPVETVFKEIKRQSHYDFLYNIELLKKFNVISINTKDASLEEVLEICFRNQPISYVVSENTILLKEKFDAAPTSDINKSSGPGLYVRASGFVYNEAGQPLSGANIVVKETKKSTITNAKGEFELASAPINGMLLVTFVGYSAKQVKITADSKIKIFLSIAENELDKVVIQAYGTTTQRLSTGDITTVTAAEIERQPVFNPLLALQGRVVGLEINQTNGFASAPIKVELRGRASIDPKITSDPLYIIDGVPLTVLEVSGQSDNRGSYGFLQGANGGPASGQSPFFSLDPKNIESIEVLKDADATSIYGSRGANGVILINTKKGRTGKAKFDLNISQGVNRVTRFYKLLNTPQYLQMRKEAVANDGYSSMLTPDNEALFFDIITWDSTRYTDWQRQLYGRVGKNTNIETSVSGGDIGTTFRIAVGYNRSTNTLTVSGADQRASVTSNISHSTLNKKFTVSLNSSYSYTQSDMVNLPGAITTAPNAPAIFDSAGNLNYDGYGGKNNNLSARGSYPFAGLKMPYVAKTNFLTANLGLVLQPLKGLKLSTNFGYNTAQANQQQLTPIASLDPLTNPLGTDQIGFNSNKNWIIEPQLNYSNFLGKGKFDFLLGGTIQHTSTDGYSASGYGYTNDALIRTIANAASFSNSENYGEYKYAAVFGRFNYNWQNEFIGNFSARRDGSSKFGSGNQFGNFGAIGTAWIFSQEKWIQDHLGLFSFGKLRVSYGITGSDGIGDYGYLTRWSSNGTQPYSGSPVLQPTQHANPNYRWQENKKLEAGLDLGFLKDRVTISASWYRDRCGNQLISYPTPVYTGFGSVAANWPALVQNTGLEFSMHAQIIETKNVHLQMNFNLAINRNKLVSYPNFELSPYYYNYIIGQPLNIARVLKYTGVDQQTGLYTFQDKNKDGQIMAFTTDPQADDRYVTVISPKYFGGFGFDFTYKTFQLNVFFNFKKQNGVNGTPVASGFFPGSVDLNMPADVLNRWQKPGDVAKYARFTQFNSGVTDSYYSASTGIYEDASFIRLSNVAVSYSLPQSYIKKTGMEAWSIFLATNNIFIITKYKGIDPETQNFGGLPPAKNINVGLNFSF